MAEVIIKIRSELVGDGFDASKRGLDGLAKEQDTIRDKAGPMGEAVTGALRHIGEMAVEAAAIAARSMGQFIADSIEKSSKFEKQMSGVAAVSGATGEDVQKLTDYALEMGAKTSFSAQEAAEGMEILAANGMSATDILAGAGQATLDLAAATGGNLTDSAAVMTDAMAVFGISAKDTTKAIDGITGVTVASKFDLQDYALALSQGGGAAMAAGVSFDDFNTAIATISPLFASGSDAGTSLKVMLSRLVPQTKDATGMMQQLGLITEDGTNVFYDAQGNLKDLGTVAEYLNGAFMDLSDAERTNAMQTIFGSDAMRAATALAMGAGDAFDDTAEAIGEVSAQKQAEVRLDNFAGSVEMMNGAMETLQITIGDIVKPALKDLIDNVIIPAIGKAQEFVNAFAKAPDKLKFLVDAIEDMGVDLDTVIPLVGGLSAAYATFSALTFARTIPALAAMAAQAWATAVPIIAMNLPLVAIAAVVGLIAAVVIANWGPLVDVFNAAGGGLEGFWAAVQLLWSIISTWVVETTGQLATLVGQWAQSFWQWIVDSWPGVVAQLGVWWGQFVGWIGSMANEVGKAFNGWMASMGQWISDAWDDTLTALGNWWNNLVAWIAAQPEAIGAAFSGWIMAMGAWLAQAWTDTLTALGIWWTSFKEWLDSRPEAMAEAFGAWLASMVVWIYKAPGQTQTALNSWWTGLTQWIQAQGTALQTQFSNWVTSFSNWATNVGPRTQAALDAWWTGLSKWVEAQGILLEARFTTWLTGFTNWASNLIPTMQTALEAWWLNLTGWIETQAPILIEKFATWATNSIAWIAEAIGKIPDEAEKFGKAVWEGITGAISNWFTTKASDAADILISFIGGFAKVLQENGIIKGDLGNSAAEVGKNILLGIARGINDAKDAVWNALKDTVTGAIDNIMKFLGIQSPSKLFRMEIGMQMGLGIAEGLTDTSGSIGRAGAIASQSALNGATSNIVNNYNYSYAPTYQGAPNVSGDAVLVQSMAGAG